VKALGRGIVTLIAGIVAAYISGIITLIVTIEILKRTQPDYRSDWDFAGYFYFFGGGVVGFLIGVTLVTLFFSRSDKRK